MSDDGSGGPNEPYDSDWFHTSPYPQPSIIWAPTPARPVNAFATLSVVFAFLFAPVGAAFGHLGLSQIRRTGERGRWIELRAPILLGGHTLVGPGLRLAVGRPD